jgi:hypothetical protein
MTSPLLAVAMIVKNEAKNLPGCLEALAALGSLIGEVVVYDTGSIDGTPEVARAAGARVELGSWDGDFARARNAATALTRARWVLIVDADERVTGDAVRLRAVLEGRSSEVPDFARVDALVMSMVNITADGSEMYAAPQVRFFRPDRAGYQGKLHERVERHDGTALQWIELGRDVVQLRHYGYSDPEVVRNKARRNLELATTAVDGLSGVDADPGDLARALYHRGRTLLSAGRLIAAAEDLQAMRRLPVDDRQVPERTWGTDVLAQLLFGLGRPDEVLPLVAELRGAGVDQRYCSWLAARVHLAGERYPEALELLRTVDGLIDSVGRVLDLGPVIEAQLIAAGRAGEVDEAAACCIRLMAGYGQVEGYGSLLLTLWGARPAAWLADLLIGADQGHLAVVAGELAGCQAPGPQIALALMGAPTSRSSNV